MCANRFLIQHNIYDEFAEKLAIKANKLKLGNGVEKNVSMGPLISQKALISVDKMVQDAVAKGAEILLGGKKSELGDHFYQPTILTNVNSSMRVFSEEIFGPVAPLFKFKTEDEAIEMANDTELGLASYVYTRDIGRIWRVAEALEYGMVGINEGIISTEVAPFGGIKQSGMGREGSKYGIEDYMEIKYLCMGGLEN